jgi:ribosome-associated protein
MTRSDETPLPPRESRRRGAGNALNDQKRDQNRDAPDSAAAPVSKTRRKAAMHDLQDLGETLVRLSNARRAELALPERLDNAIVAAQSITKWEGRRRQMQFIGKLMRDVDPEPIRTRIAQWNTAPAAEKARLSRVERWRERLLSDADALALLAADAPAADRSRLATLIARTQAERLHGQPPHAYRELFRVLNTLLSQQPGDAKEDAADDE